MINKTQGASLVMFKTIIKRSTLFIFTLLVSFGLWSQDYTKIANEFSSDVEALGPKMETFSVVDVSFEGGVVHLQKIDGSGELVKINMGKSGGMGTVVPPTAEAISHYAGNNGLKIEMNTVSPYLCGPMCSTSIETLADNGYLTKINTFTVKVNGQAYSVDAYAGKTSYGGKQYLLSCPELWDNYFGEKGNPFKFTDKGLENYLKVSSGFSTIKGRDQDMMSLMAYVGFSQATAKLFDAIDADVAIINDYHPALSVFYTDMPALLIGHNMAFHGIIPVNNNEAAYWDNDKAVKFLAKFTNLSEDVIEKYFRVWNTEGDVGAASIVKAAITRLRELTGIGLVVVSEQYAEELKMDYFQTRDKVISRNPDLGLDAGFFSDDRAAERIISFYKSLGLKDFNRGNASTFFVKEESRGLDAVKNTNIVGVVNGQDQVINPDSDPKLKDIVKNPYGNNFFNEKSKDFLAEVAKDPYFENGLNFSTMDPERFFKAKEVIRKLMLMEFFPNNPEIWDNKDAFIVYNFGRMTDQKGAELLFSNVDKMTANGDIVIIVGTEPGGIYSDLAKIMSTKAENMQKDGKYFAYTSRFTPYYYVYGADLKVTPSYFEPCGMTPAEANRGGVPVLVSDVGGLQRFQDAFKFNMVHSDPWTTSSNLYAGYEEARNEWYSNRSAYEDRMLRVALKDYSYEKPAGKYIELLTIAFTKDMMNKAITVAEAYSKGLTTYANYRMVKDAVMKLPEWLRESYVNYATKFSSYEESKAFFFGASNSTIEGLFSTDKEVESPEEYSSTVSAMKYSTAVETELSAFEKMAYDFAGHNDFLNGIGSNEAARKKAIMDFCIYDISFRVNDQGQSLEEIFRPNLQFFLSKDGFMSEYIKGIKYIDNYQERTARLHTAGIYLKALLNLGNEEGLDKVTKGWILASVDEVNAELNSVSDWMKAPRGELFKENFNSYYKNTYKFDLKVSSMEELLDIAIVEGIKDPGTAASDWVKMMCGTYEENYQDGLLYYLNYRAEKTLDDLTRANRQYQLLVLSRNSFSALIELKEGLESSAYKVTYERSKVISEKVKMDLDPSKEMDPIKKELREQLLKEVKEVEREIERIRERAKAL